MIYFFVCIKMIYYQKQRDRLLENKKQIFQKGAEYYLTNKDILKESAKNKYRYLSQEKKGAKRAYE